jgi:maltose alpha-D-glucosyltransferase/alpha-amylase
MLTRVFDVLRRRAGTMPPATAELARALLPREADIQARLRRVTTTRIDALRIRHHGDLHLGQVLCAGEDVVIIDFEGEPARPLHERRYKRGALRDVTGMLRSFQYAAASALRTGKLRSEDVAALAGAARAWHEWVGGAYLAAYLGEAGGTRLVPSRDADRELMLEFYALEKCIYEVGYELNNRPDWLDVPLTGMLELLEEPAG